MDAELTNRIVLLLTNGMTPAAAEAYAVRQGERPASARRIVVEARRRITLAADYNRAEAMGKAVSRLEALYAAAIVAKPPDRRTALAAQKELNRLMGLHDTSNGGEDEAGGDAERRLALVKEHLLPLGLADETYPVEEHARLAAEFVRRAKSES